MHAPALDGMDQPTRSSLFFHTAGVLHLPKLKGRPSMPGIDKPESMHPAVLKLTRFPDLLLQYATR